MTQKAKAEVEAYLRKGQKLAAIKHLHDKYRFSLVQSKILVDAMEGKFVAAPAGAVGEDEDVPWDESAKGHVRDLLTRGKTIDAIAYTRRTLGVSLKEAKDLVEGLAGLMNPAELPHNKVPFFARVILAAFGIPGVIMLAVAGVLVYNQNQSLKESELVTGRVVNLNTNDGMTAPVFEYEWNGQQWLHASTTYSSPPAYVINEAVPIYVNRNDPQDIIVDTFMDRWFLTTLLGSLGLFFTLIPVLAGVLSRSFK